MTLQNKLQRACHTPLSFFTATDFGVVLYLSYVIGVAARNPLAQNTLRRWYGRVSEYDSRQPRLDYHHRHLLLSEI